MSERKPSNWLYLLTAAVLLLGTLMVLVGTRSSPDEQAHGSHMRQTNNVTAACSTSTDSAALIERGAAIQQMECAGCHDGNARQIGPSYSAIAALYRCRPAELSAAIGHPKPGWADYPQGPKSSSLNANDQAALVSWILNAGGDRNE